jgi:hypothetical protein
MSLIIPYATSSAVWPFPAVPEPILGPDGNGQMHWRYNTIPHNGTLVNQVRIPTAFGFGASANEYEGLLSESSVWTLDASDVNVACSGFVGVCTSWYDDVNDRLYIFALNTGTTPDTIYTAYITLETGAITNVGNVQFSTDPTGAGTLSNVAIGRSAIDSGNFVLRFIDRTVTINESTGAEVSNIAESNRTGIYLPGSYTTLDGTITMAYVQQFNDGNGYIELIRNGIGTRVSIKYFLGFTAASATAARPMNWGSLVKMYGSTTGAYNPMVRTFDRTAFDAWLAEVAAFGGI